MLVCDDSTVERSALAQILRRQGYEVDEAADGSAALRLIKGRAYDLLLLDLNMPDVDGFDVLGYVQANQSKLPVVLMSGLPHEQIGDGIQRLPHHELPAKLAYPTHAFWPLAGNEKPPGGESMAEVITRVGGAMERLAKNHAGVDVVIVSHGGAIRGAIAHALRIEADNALHMSIQNLSLSRLQRTPGGWRVVCVNELPGY